MISPRIVIHLPRIRPQVGGSSTLLALWVPRILLAGVVVACTAALTVQYVVLMRGYISDDAFISFRYATNLADGLGPVWGTGDRVEGYTNFGWVLLMALSAKLGMDVVDTSRALGLIASAGTFALVPFLAAQLRPAWSGRWWLMVVGASAALALNSGVALWTFAGLETTAQLFLITAAIALHLWEERRGARPIWSAPVFVAAALIRPDAVVFWAITALHKGRRLLSRDWRSQLPGLIFWAALFIVPYGGYWLWRWSYYGYFFPNTYYLKTERSLSFFGRGWDYAWNFFTIYWAWLALASLVSIWRERRASYRPATYLLAVSALWFAYVVYSGGDWMPYYRFFVSVLPILYVLMMHGAIDVIDLLGRKLAPRALLFGAMAIIAVLVAFSALRPHDNGIAKQTVVFNSDILPGAVDFETQKAIGLWLRDNLPPDYTVAQIATGIVPYFSRLPTIDMLGVNDVHIAHLDSRLGPGPAGHEKQDGGYVVARQPEIIWLAINIEGEPRDVIDDYLPPRYPYPYPLNTAITKNAYTWFLYRPVAIPFGGAWLNLLVRNDVDIPALTAAQPRP